MKANMRERLRVKMNYGTDDKPVPQLSLWDIKNCSLPEYTVDLGSHIMTANYTFSFFLYKTFCSGVYLGQGQLFMNPMTFFLTLTFWLFSCSELTYWTELLLCSASVDSCCKCASREHVLIMKLINKKEIWFYLQCYHKDKLDFDA